MARKTSGAIKFVTKFDSFRSPKLSSVPMSNSGGQPMVDEPLPRVANAEHLTDVLRRNGLVGNGRVLGIQVESDHPQLISRVIRLRLTYDRAVDAPSSLILKVRLLGQSGIVLERGRREVEFYTRLATMIRAHLFPRCFDADFAADTKAWHLLLEDLTDTHAVATQWPLPPTTEDCKRMLGVLARFHAGWWDDPRLGVSVGHGWIWVTTRNVSLTSSRASRTGLVIVCRASGANCTSDL
jgi:Ecdysteroid kinase-like family